MQLDPNIILGAKPAQIESPVNALAKVLQVQESQQMNQQRGMQMQDAAKQRETQNRLQALLSQYGNAQDLPDQLAKSGFLEQATAVQKSRGDAVKQTAEAGKITAETEKTQIANTLAKIELVGQIMAGVNDQATYDQAREVARANGIDVSQMAPEYNPQQIEINKQRAMSVAQRLEQVWKQKGYDLDVQKFGETKRSNKADEAIKVRGQNMTDDRTRDLNANKVEENKLKADEGRRTADMTRSSQVASFDTMLGTLERLGSHPGLGRSVGVMGTLPTMPGSESANFQAELETFQSQAFIPMVAQLKGMGALSDAEGKKLTAAVGALNPKMGEKAFRDSIARITADMQAARNRVTGSAPAAQGGKTMSMADVKATAKARGMSEQQVIEAAKAKGFAIQ